MEIIIISILIIAASVLIVPIVCSNKLKNKYTKDNYEIWVKGVMAKEKYLAKQILDSITDDYGILYKDSENKFGYYDVEFDFVCHRSGSRIKGSLELNDNFCRRIGMDLSYGKTRLIDHFYHYGKAV